MTDLALRASKATTQALKKKKMSFPIQRLSTLVLIPISQRNRGYDSNRVCYYLSKERVDSESLKLVIF